MASPAVTYIFANSTVADATQINQNFTDLINGATDSTRDYAVKNLTLASTGTANLLGNVVLGTSTSNTINMVGTIISTLIPGAALTYNLGTATLPWQYLYIGQASKAVQIAGSSSGSATAYTLTLPLDGGSSRYRVETDGSGGLSFQPKLYTAKDATNLGLAASVSANALTVAIKGIDGSDPSATNPVDIVFRSSTAATGTPVTRTLTSASSLVVANTATMGMTNGTQAYLYFYAIDNAGTIEPAISGCSFFDQGTRQTTTALSTGSDSATVLYSTVSRSNVGIRLLGRLSVTEASAGVWATAPSELTVGAFAFDQIIRAHYQSTTATSWTSSANIVNFDTKVSDVHGCVTTGVAWKFIAPIAGTYRVSFNLTFTGLAGTSGTSFLYANLLKNGSAVELLGSFAFQSSNPPAPSISGSTTIDLAATDYIQISSGASAVSAGTLNGGATSNCISIERIGS